jgi:hypothetical protein
MVWACSQGGSWIHAVILPEFLLVRLTCPIGQAIIVSDSWRESHGGSAGDGQS